MKALNVCLLAFVAATAGCAFGDRHATLAYKPPPGDARPATGQAAVVERPVDLRPDPKNIIGCVRNGWGMKTADVLATNDVRDWVAYALEAELKRAGFRVEPAPGAESALRVKSEIMDVFCNMGFSYEAKLRVKVSARRGGKALIDQAYVAEEGSTNWGASGSGVEEAFQQSMGKVMAQFAEDLKGVGSIP